MGSNGWKALERKSAALLGGRRIYRGDNFSESRPDVIAPLSNIFPIKKEGTVIAECKYSVYQPWITNKTIAKSFIDQDNYIFSASSKDLKQIFIFFRLNLINGLDCYRAFSYIKKISKKSIRAHCIINKNVSNNMVKHSLQCEEYITCDYVKDNNHGEPYFPLVILGKKNSPVKLAYFNINYLNNIL